MKQYLDLIRDIMAHGTERKDRTGVGTISVFGRQIRFDMRNGFPAICSCFGLRKKNSGKPEKRAVNRYAQRL